MKENLIPLASEVKNKDDISNSSEIDCSLGVDDLTIGNENDAIDSVELCAMPKELFENDTEFYTDKNVTECELPELIVCYNESTYNVIKDICVDDGAHSEKEILIKNVKDDLNGLESKSSSQESYEECGDNNKEGVNGLKSPSDKDSNRDAANECGNKDKVDLDLRTVGELKYSSGDDIDLNSSSESDSDQENSNTIDKSMDVSSRDEFLLKSVPLLDELRPQTSSKSILVVSSDCGCNDDGQHSCQISNEEAIPEHPAPIPAPEESNKSDRVNNVSCESKMESGTVTCDINSCKPTTITKNPGPKDVNEQPCKILNKDGMMDNLSVGNKVQREEGESSFCMAGPNSGIISYSGPISYSGSISLRSDSSTTSTRSFAFPVLQNEWNSSPIRMAKAERGYFRRHRRWKEGLLCCRF